MKIKNILFLNDFGSVNGGASKIAFTEMLALKAQGFNVIFLCGVGPVDSTLEEHGIKTFCLGQEDILTCSRIIGFCRGIWNQKARKIMLSILSKYSPNDTVVHIHGWSKCLSASVLNVGDSMGFKTFITLHDFFLYCPNGGLLDYKRNQICNLKPMSLKCFACNCDSRSILHKYWRYARQVVQNVMLSRCINVNYISISKLSNDIFLKYRPQLTNHLFRIDNPIDFNTSACKPTGQIQLGNKYLFVGRLSEEKGIRLFLDAVSQLEVEAEVWGDGYLMDELKAKYPNVVFRGWVNNKQKITYLNNVRALVFPSIWYETFGLVVAEMLSLGIPCIVGDKTAAREFIEDGKNGYLFEIGNLASLKDAINKMEITYTTLHPLDYFNNSKYSIQFHVDRLVKLYNDSL